MADEKKERHLRVIQGGRGANRPLSERRKKSLENWEKIRNYWAKRCDGLFDELDRVSRLFAGWADAKSLSESTLHRCFVRSRKEGYDDARKYLIDEINVMRIAIGEAPITSMKDCLRGVADEMEA